jgi:deazaflavin-dependent oxidoreductase (nitroreductase family)
MAMAQQETRQTGRKLSGPAKAGFRIFTGLHAAIYRLSGGRLWNKMGQAPTLLLTTTGRKSGKERVTPLLYLGDGDNLVIVASMGGAAQNPGWWHNLRDNPEARVQIGKRTLRVRAEQADAAERARLWPRLVAMFPNYAEYQRATSREIPVVVLHPIDS